MNQVRQAHERFQFKIFDDSKNLRERSRREWTGPIVRVIWNGACGSTYQRYVPPGRQRPLLTLGGHLGFAGSDEDGGGSIFSRPLSCPRCQHSFEIHQPDPESPDWLFGTCSHCQTKAHLEVGDGGKITLNIAE
jgi:hypothetical protein